MPKWNTKKFNEKSNADLTLCMWIVYNEVKKIGSINIMHMKSHNKNKWGDYEDDTYEKYCFDQNDYVDNMCKYARITLNKATEIIETVVYK